MSEIEPQFHKPNFVRRIGEGMGVIETREQREVKKNAFNAELDARIKESIKTAHIYASHTDACLSKIEYTLGITDRDPHPNHPITFTECNHQL